MELRLRNETTFEISFRSMTSRLVRISKKISLSLRIMNENNIFLDLSKRKYFPRVYKTRVRASTTFPSTLLIPDKNQSSQLN